jgi:hypothetical protein
MFKQDKICWIDIGPYLHASVFEIYVGELGRQKKKTNVHIVCQDRCSPDQTCLLPKITDKKQTLKKGKYGE